MQPNPVRAAARAVAGPAVRRVRREIQWRSCGSTLRLERGSAESYPHAVMEHETPLFRQLAGVDQQLQRNKVVNLRLALERLDGLILPPGQRFSFWWHVRKATARRGFLDGVVLSHGQVVAGVGGGLCQLTNLIYWMTLHTPLTVVERWRHSYDVFPDTGRTQPFGSGATCAWPVLDLQITNPTTTAFRLGLGLSNTHLQGAWTADAAVTTTYQVYESDHLMANAGPGVFVRHNVVKRRTFSPAGVQMADELVAVNEARMMYQPFLEAERS
ncbi:MAG TPA: VanW family protein [Kineosporiaceae bacterium]|nr:VanW family protein [Kineosporiaceae bacterium]